MPVFLFDWQAPHSSVPSCGGISRAFKCWPDSVLQSCLPACCIWLYAFRYLVDCGDLLLVAKGHAHQARSLSRQECYTLAVRFDQLLECNDGMLVSWDIVVVMYVAQAAPLLRHTSTTRFEGKRCNSSGLARQTSHSKQSELIMHSCLLLCQTTPSIAGAMRRLTSDAAPIWSPEAPGLWREAVPCVVAMLRVCCRESQLVGKAWLA